MIAATVEDVMVLASEGVGVRVRVEPLRTEEDPPGMEPLLAAMATHDGGRFFFLRRRW